MKPVALNAAVVTLTPNVGADTDALPAGGTTVRIHNAGTQVVFVKSSVATSDATASSTPIPAGAVESFTVDAADRFVSAYCAGSATVYVQRSDGF
jgi:hypothetical protein